jgi:hypothetical protein
VDLFRSYFEGALEEGSVKRNFTLIYELLDEAMDFGFPQVGVKAGGGGPPQQEAQPGCSRRQRCLVSSRAARNLNQKHSRNGFIKKNLL